MLTTLAAMVVMASCAQTPRGDGGTPEVLAIPATDLAEFVRRYTTDRDGVGRFYDVEWSEARFDRMDALFKEWQDRLAAVPYDGLSLDAKVDATLLRLEIGHERARLDLSRRRLAEMDPLLPFRGAVQSLEWSRRKMERVDAENAAGSLAGLPEQIKALRKRIKKAEGNEAKEGEIGVSAVVAQRASGAVREIRRTLREWFDFYNGYQPEFSWWTRKPYTEAVEALDEYAKFLREEIAGLKGKDDDPLVGDPIGAGALAADLSSEAIALSPAELVAIGERELAWCEARMKEASRAMGLGDDWKAALARVKAGHVPPGEQDDLVTEQARFAIAFVRERDLVTVPALCDETWRLTMISPEVQKVLPFAAYGGQNMMVAYPTDAMKHDDKLMSMRGNNRHFTRIVTPHELIPGHHLQRFVSERSRPYRLIFSTPFFVEGWALYWEMRLWELGYATTPEDRLGMLFWRAHRAARIIVSLRFHLGEMTPAEMIEFLVDRVGHERWGATSEVRRFIGGDYSPLYQCGYMIGGLQLIALRRELVETGRMTDKAFNDAVLSQNTMPIEVLRAALRGEAPAREFVPTWRFDAGN
ncbi:MAG: DUF885 domain-containing protein [Phycisphaerae bacterium]|nr:DUF885 domain-containing protein [Phycisphaerae bacterium]